jgi:hypothetical protein
VHRVKAPIERDATRFSTAVYQPPARARQHEPVFGQGRTKPRRAPSKKRGRRKPKLRGAARSPEALREVGDWIARMAPWSVFATLTFEAVVEEPRATAALDRWVRILAERSGEHVTVAYAYDYQSSGFLHFHALIGFESWTESTSVFLYFGRLWGRCDRAAGWTNFRLFNPAEGAPWYLPEHAEVGAGVTCPRRRNKCKRGRCPHTRCPL